MCKRTNIIKFCTCDVITDTNAVNWKLDRSIGTNGSHIRGTVIRTKSDLGNGITVKNIIKVLNSKKNIFDFEYQPIENDCLTIVVDKSCYTLGYFILRFKKGKWIAGSGHPFNSVKKLLYKGKIKLDYRKIYSANKFSILFNFLRKTTPK